MTSRSLLLIAPMAVVAFPLVAAAQPLATPLPRIEPLTRGRGTAIVANSDVIADELAQYVKEPHVARDEAILDDVRDVMTPASEWRWYWRDHSLLVAVPVRERLRYGVRSNAEALLAIATRRAIHERGWGSPPVQVVFIEPEVPCHVPSLDWATGSAAGFARIAGAGGTGTAGDGFAGGAGGCNCR